MAWICVLAGVLSGVSAALAWDVASIPEPVPPSSGAVVSPEARESSGASLDAVLAGLQADPFDPERGPPGRRLALGDPVQDAPTPISSNDLRLIGTALLPEGDGFALCAWGDERPRMVQIDESIGPFTLRALRPGEADFTDTDGERMTVTVPKESR